MYENYPGYQTDPKVWFLLERCRRLDIDIWSKKTGKLLKYESLRHKCLKRIEQNTDMVVRLKPIKSGQKPKSKKKITKPKVKIPHEDHQHDF